MNTDNLKKGFAHIKEGMKLVDKNQVGFYLDYLIECQEEFFKRCAPFKIGDIVEIIKAPNTDNSWKDSAHYLKVGCKGEVMDIGFSKGKFGMYVKMFNQTYKSYASGEYKPRELEDYYKYYLTEDLLRIAGS